MDEEHISYDPRIAFCMFVLDRPGLFEEVFSNRIDISNLMSQMNMLHLIFSKSATTFSNSMTSLTTMFEKFVQQKKYPDIDERLVQYLITKKAEQLVANPACRKILSHIIFSTCHAQVTGLTARKLVAMVKIEKQ